MPVLTYISVLILLFFLHYDMHKRIYNRISIPFNETFIFIQGGHIPAKIKFPVFSLSFPCAR